MGVRRRLLFVALFAALLVGGVASEPASAAISVRAPNLVDVRAGGSDRAWVGSGTLRGEEVVWSRDELRSGRGRLRLLLLTLTRGRGRSPGQRYQRLGTGAAPAAGAPVGGIRLRAPPTPVGSPLD